MTNRFTNDRPVKLQKCFKKQNSLFVVKATALKQQRSLFYPQIIIKEACFYIYNRPMTDINVMASFCA